MDTALVTGAFALIGAALGFAANVITNAINSRNSLRVSEQARLLDLYKLVFPDKYNASKEIMSMARPLVEKMLSVYHSAGRQRNSEVFASEAERMLDAFYNVVVSNAWLIGDGPADKAKSLYGMCSHIYSTSNFDPMYERDFGKKMTGLLEELNTAMREELRLADLAMAIPHSDTKSVKGIADKGLSTRKLTIGRLSWKKENNTSK